MDLVTIYNWTPVKGYKVINIDEDMPACMGGLGLPVFMTEVCIRPVLGVIHTVTSSFQVVAKSHELFGA